MEDALIPLLEDMDKVVDVDNNQNLKEKIQTTIDKLKTNGKLANHSHGANLFKDMTQQYWTGLRNTLTALKSSREHNKSQLQAFINQHNPDVLKTLPLRWKEDDGRLTPLLTESKILELENPALTAILQNPTVGACLVTQSDAQFYQFIDNISQKGLENLAMAFEQLNNTLKKYETGDTSAILSVHQKKDNPTKLRTTMATHLLTWVSEHVTDFKRWPMDAVRQAYALLAPAIGKSTTPEGLTNPLTTADRVTVDSQLRQPIKTVDKQSLNKLGIKSDNYQKIILKSKETNNGFLALQKRLEADCPGSHCVHVPKETTNPPDSTTVTGVNTQFNPNTFVRSGRTKTTTAIIELFNGSATTIINELTQQGKGAAITTLPTDNVNMRAKNQELMGTGFCWKETNETYTLHFQAHICTGMDDSIWKRSDEQPWLNDMHQSVAKLTEKAPVKLLYVTINYISFTIDPPMVTEHPQSKIGHFNFASALTKAKKGLPQKIDTIIEQQRALGNGNHLFITTLNSIKTKTTHSDTLTTEIDMALSQQKELNDHQKMFLRSIMHLYTPPQEPRKLKKNQVSTEGSGTFYQIFTIETLDLAFSALANCTPCYQCKSGQDRTKTMSIFHEMANDPTYIQMLANGFNTNEERTQFGLRFFELATQNLGIAEQARPEGIVSGNKAIIKWNLNHVLFDHPIPKQMLDWACLPNNANKKIQTLQSNLNKKQTELMQLGAKQLIKELKRNPKKTPPVTV